MKTAFHSIARLALFGLLASAGLHAAIWPEQWWEYKRLSLEPVKLTDKAVWDEYGLDESGIAQYDDGKVKFRATGYRVRDTTAAMAVFQWLRPAGWRNSKVTDLAATNGADTLFTQGNYIFWIEGFLPDQDKLDILYVQLPRMERSALPPLASYLPGEGLIDGSRRFITGPVSMAQFEPRIPPSVAAFRFGAEAQLGRYTAPTGEISLAVLSYPTPAIARGIAEKMEQIPGAFAKRSGPMVIAAFSADADAAERLLAKVNYNASVSWNETTVVRNENPGEMLTSIFELIGVLIGGIAFCGVLIFLTKWFGRKYWGWGPANAPMVTLSIDGEHRP